MTNLKFSFPSRQDQEQFEIIAPIIGAVKEGDSVTFMLGIEAFRTASYNFDFTELDRCLADNEEIDTGINTVTLYIHSYDCVSYELEIGKGKYAETFDETKFTYCKVSFDEWL